MVGAAEAEEVVQEAFERGMRQPNFFNDVREPTAWLRAVAARIAISRLRRRRLLDRLRLSSRSQTLEPWERADLALALAKLSPRDRIVVVLRYVEDASYDEIAEAVGGVSSSVGPILSRARARMREVLV